ncbi:MAG: hypothetical protein HC910_02250 [Spirulinaceae cyanobacterium SM2_1_0]|nr:hypothetical protein [Spirulinaceae cyanobacterium SM2_1_0]
MSHQATGEVDRLFQQLRTLLLQTWQETGYGKLEIESERTNQNRIRVVLKAGTYYAYVLREEDVKDWGFGDCQ